MPSYCPTCSITIDDASALDSCPKCGARAPEDGFPDDLRIGQLVAGDQYRVVRRIGSGGFGVVYEVATTVGDLRRALKVLHPHLLENSDVKARFVNEARAMEQVNHPSIARCYAAGKLDDGALYLLFELIDGAELSQILSDADNGRLEPIRAVRLAKQVASGLRAAHDAGVLHRDLKPDNIMVLAAGSLRERVCIVDFGIAKLTEQGTASTLTIVGTPEFMAPEQFLPGSLLDVRVDLWQLGAVLFQMLVGQAPYGGPGSSVATIAAEQQRRPDLGPAPSEVDATFKQHPALDLFVSRLLATDVDRRPSTAVEVCEDLARIEHALSPASQRSGSEALLGALCATPSDSGWLALHGYLGGQTDERESLVGLAQRMLEGWSDEMRCAPCTLWEEARRGPLDSTWPLVRTLDLSARGIDDEELARIADNPALATITRLDLSHNDIGNTGVAALAGSPYLSALSHLNLEHNRISSKGLVALSQSRGLPCLRALRLSHNGIGSRGVEALCASSLRLFELHLADNDLAAAGASTLAQGEAFSGLMVLGLSRTGIGGDGVAAIAVSDQLTRLRSLDLSHNNIGPSGAAALALSKNMSALHTLRLDRNSLGREGLQLLLGSSSFGTLENLDLSGNRLGAPGAMLLSGSPFLRRLGRLELGDNSLGDAGIAALIGSANLGGLRQLGLSQNEVTPSGAGLLSDAPPQLDSLDLCHNPLGAEGGAAVAEALRRLRVTRLSLAGCELDGRQLSTILDAGRLSALDASRNPVGVSGGAAIAAAFGASTLQELVARHAQLGTEGVGELARSQYLGGLRMLDLSENELGDGGVTSLVASAPRLSRLEHLELSANGLGVDAAEALSASTLAIHLGRLGLSHNDLGDAGAEALARGNWHALRALDLERNGLSLAGATAITSAKCLGALQRVVFADNALTNVLDPRGISDDALTLLEQCFARIAPAASDLAETFYEDLFERYPNVKPLFANVNMAAQQKHLIAALVMVIDNLRNPDALDNALVALARRHVGYGVAPTHYYAVCSTLLEGIRKADSEHWSDALELAWQDALDGITNVMLTGAARPARVDPAAATENQPG